ncbi:MAG: response regulator transcription factor [Bdellovibrionales bacterium]|nr:response regulator transcription factor [Bdellovibrionales bacterium]
MIKETNSSARILVVEDEVKLLQRLSETLQEQGYWILPCESYQHLEELVLLNDQRFDVIILDRLLHSKDSAGFITAIKQRQPECKILVLSAISTSAEKAAILNMGADDYMSKPFDSDELAARVRVLQRRSRPEVRFGNLVLNIEDRTLIADDQVVPLQNKEFALLRTLIQSPGKVFNKNDLYEQVWGISTDVESNVIEATVNKLRRRLKEVDAGITIKNMRNIGYWIEE